MSAKSKLLRIKRKSRNRFKLKSNSTVDLRLTVFRSNTNFYSQIIDDRKGITLVSASTLEKEIKAKIKNKGGNKSAAELVGNELAKRADKKGIKRYSFNYLPMDECLTRCCIDISGRPWLVWNVFLPNITIKNIETEIFREFFQSFSQSAEITLHIENIYGQNTHHIIESCFKSMAISLRNAINLDLKNLDNVPSTKGTLTGNM